MNPQRHRGVGGGDVSCLSSYRFFFHLFFFPVPVWFHVQWLFLVQESDAPFEWAPNKAIKFPSAKALLPQLAVSVGTQYPHTYWFLCCFSFSFDLCNWLKLHLALFFLRPLSNVTSFLTSTSTLMVQISLTNTWQLKLGKMSLPGKSLN